MKALAALKWISIYCKRADYILKADDDVFVNAFALRRYIYRLHTSDRRTRLIHCRIWKHAPVVRTGKWAVSTKDMSRRVYPDYCAGLAYVLTGDVARAFYRMSLRVRFFWIDDVYLTGDLVTALGGQVTLTDITMSYFRPIEAQRLLQNQSKRHRSVHWSSFLGLLVCYTNVGLYRPVL